MGETLSRSCVHQFSYFIEFFASFLFQKLKLLSLSYWYSGKFFREKWNELHWWPHLLLVLTGSWRSKSLPSHSHECGASEEPPLKPTVRDNEFSISVSTWLFLKLLSIKLLAVFKWFAAASCCSESSASSQSLLLTRSPPNSASIMVRNETETLSCWSRWLLGPPGGTRGRGRVESEDTELAVEGWVPDAELEAWGTSPPPTRGLTRGPLTKFLLAYSTRLTMLLLWGSWKNEIYGFM